MKLKLIILLLFLFGTACFGNSNDLVVTHDWWETGNYSSNVVAELVLNEQARLADVNERVSIIGTNATTIEWLKPKYNWDLTNQVNWMVCHVAPTNSPTISMYAWEADGIYEIQWRESLTSGKWERVTFIEGRHPDGIKHIIIRMHPTSELTNRMLASTTGFFRINQNGYEKWINQYMNGKWKRSNKIYNINLSEFFPIVEKETIPNRAALMMEPSIQLAPPAPGG